MDDSLPHRSSRDADRCRPARCPGSSGYRRRGHIPCHIPPEVPGATRPDRRRRSRCVPRPRHRPTCSYAQTMSALAAAYGDRLLDALDGPAVAALAAHSWGALAPATWNRHVATLARSPCSAAAPAGCRSTCAPAWNGAQSEPTAPRPSPTPRWSGCSAARTSPSGRSACGGCCMRPPPARRKFSPSTSRTSTWTTSAPGRSPKAVTPSGCIFSPAPLVCCPASSPDVRPGRCSSPIAAPHPPAPQQLSTSAPSPVGGVCPTSAPSTCSSGTPGGSAATD